jgi:hypothetical protein
MGLINGERSPKRKRRSAIEEEIKGFIIKYREQHKGVGQRCKKPELDRYCEEKGLVGNRVTNLQIKGRRKNKE